MIALIGSVLVSSLVGSPHCAGMCGGFVCFVAGDGRGAGRRLAVAAYNAGRLLSYLALGLVAGAVGHGVDRLGAAAGVARAAATAAGALMVLWGGFELGKALGWWRAPRPRPAPWHGALAAAARAVRDWPPAARGLAIGLATTLLPCGFLYAFVAVAAGTGSAISGVLVMAAFWLGTVPVMAGLGLVAEQAIARLRRRAPAWTALALLAIGLLTLAGRLTPRPNGHGAHAPATHEATHGDR